MMYTRKMLQVNATKSKLAFERDGQSQCHISQNGEDIKVYKFKHLGILINNNGSRKAEAKTKLNSGEMEVH